ncbi:MAG: hypothetical protein K1W24_06500 [Lachnospiraceae bacterium]
MEIRDFKAGQTVYIELTGNASRGKTPEQCIEEWEITSVGRKYIKAGRRFNGTIWRETKFEYRENYGKFVQKTDCCIDYILYTTRQEIEERIERDKLFNEIRRRFERNLKNDISLEQLREIHGILSEKEYEKCE